MRSIKKGLLTALISIVVFIISSDLYAAVTPEQAKQLKNNLTPLGAIRKANIDGSIPAWGFDNYDQVSHSKWLRDIEKEQVLVLINSENMEDHKDYLSVGLQKLLTSYPDTFNIPLYPTHRTAKYPQWLYDNAYKNATEAKISPSGEEVTFAWPGIPFPIPKNAKEVIWNHQLRWKGLFFKLHTIESIINRNGSFNLIKNTLEVYSVYHNINRPRQINDWRYTYYLSYIKAPSRIAGGAYLSHETMKPVTNPRQSWIYLAGQRRMRRSPVVGYDAPTFTSDGLRMMDEVDIFNGAMDRYDWELKGVQEMYIPYNNGVLQQALLNEKNVLTPHHINPKFTRYEKHRVWIVDSVLKPGKEHIYKRRTFYLDEDTWGIMLADIYDENDKLWRVPQRYAVFYENVPVILTALDSFSDLKKQSYYIQGVPSGQAEHFDTPPPKGYFSPTIVRQRMHR